VVVVLCFFWRALYCGGAAECVKGERNVRLWDGQGELHLAVRAAGGKGGVQWSCGERERREKMTSTTHRRRFILRRRHTWGEQRWDLSAVELLQTRRVCVHPSLPRTQGTTHTNSHCPHACAHIYCYTRSRRVMKAAGFFCQCASTCVCVRV
jgi:hypothetical protein